jgi:predicted RNA-binding protein
MCVPDVYLLKDDAREVVFREVETMIVDNGELVFTNIAGETYRTRASLREINMVEHIILLEESESS